MQLLHLHRRTGRHASEGWHLRPETRKFRGMRGGWTYIVTNKPHGVLYTGVTADLARRLEQHRTGTGSKFAHGYNCAMLVYVEQHDEIENAILREKRIKSWQRMWKLRLIQEFNPTWRDLSGDFLD